ncbi:hypothetical protein DFS33DRAFT_1451925 [Desarmillaria ectypa]|nr:hypothetical protein DFS33DRAFT_1451925 [Desarmillaria ectypa]
MSQHCNLLRKNGLGLSRSESIILIMGEERNKKSFRTNSPIVRHFDCLNAPLKGLAFKAFSIRRSGERSSGHIGAGWARKEIRSGKACWRFQKELNTAPAMPELKIKEYTEFLPRSVAHPRQQLTITTVMPGRYANFDPHGCTPDEGISAYMDDLRMKAVKTATIITPKAHHSTSMVRSEQSGFFRREGTTSKFQSVGKLEITYAENCSQNFDIKLDGGAGRFNASPWNWF